MPSTYVDDVTLPTRTSLTAMSECEVCHVPRHILLQWVEKDRRNYEHIIHHECRKSLVFVQHIELLSIPTVRCRIATLLLSLCSSVGEDCEEGLRIPLRLTCLLYTSCWADMIPAELCCGKREAERC